MSIKTHIRALYILLIFSVWFPWISLIVVLYLSMVMIQRCLFLSSIPALFIASLCISAYFAFSSFFIDFINPSVPQFELINLSLIVISLIYINFKLKSTLPDIRVHSSDVVGIIICILAAVFLLVPVLNSPGPSETIHFLSSGEDNASHFAMFNRIWDTQSPPYFDSAGTGLIESLNIYPQGIHYTFGYIYWAFLGQETLSIAALLKLYYLMGVLASLSLVYVSYLLILRYSNKMLGTLSASLGSIVIFISVILYLMGWGFVTQVIALTYILSLYYVLDRIQGLVSGDKKTAKVTLAQLSVTLLMVIGIIYSWYLLLPLASLLFIPLFRHINWRDPRLYFLVAATFFVAISPILLNFFAGKGSGALNEDGGVYKYQAWAYSTVLISLVLIVFARFYRKASIPQLAMIGVFGSLGLAMGVGAYQLATSGTITYYYYKNLYLLLIIAVIIIAASSSTIAAKGMRGSRDLVLRTILIVIVFVLTYALINPVFPRVYANNWFNHLLLPGTMSPVVRHYSDRDARDVVYVEHCSVNTPGDYIANRWSGAVFISENQMRNKLEIQGLRENSNKNTLDEYIKHHPGTIVEDFTCL